VPPSEHSLRRLRLAAGLAGEKLDALIVSALPNIRYLTGFTGSNALLLVHPDTAILFTDPRYAIQAAEETDCRLRIARGPLPNLLLSILKRKPVKTVGFEKSRIPYDLWESLDKDLPSRTRLKPAVGLVEQLRAVKSPIEIASIRRSVEILCQAFAAALPTIRHGIREFELAAELDHQMRLLGADQPAFETIVASGPRSALPHARPTSKTLDYNELLLMDMGAHHAGFASDMTRMAFLGRPSPQASLLVGAVRQAQAAAVASVRPGVKASAVDRTARDVLKTAGLDRLFTHSTGHGLGLEVHESPRIGKREKTPLQAGMVVTIEPGVYMKGFGGVRIEDTVLVTETGCEVLTTTPKELLEI